MNTRACAVVLGCLGGTAFMTPAWAGNVLERELEFGLGLLDESAFRYGKYSGLVDSGFEVIANFNLASRPVWNSGEVQYWRIGGERLGLDSRRIEAEAGRQGTGRLQFSYQATPRNLFDDGVSPFLGAGTGALQLPAGWDATGASTAEMTVTEENLLDFSSRTRRRELALDYRHLLGKQWQVDLNLSRQIRDGRGEHAGTFGFTGGNARAALLPAPIDHETDRIDFSITRAAGPHQLGLAYHGSFFSNDNRSLEWQNPFGVQAQWQPSAGFPEGRGALALTPDNRFQQVRLFGQFRLTDTTRASIDLARGRMEQDQAFLPFTENLELAVPVGLPRASLDGEVDTRLAHLRVTSRPLPRLHLTGRVRFEDRDNNTPREVYLPVTGDARDQVAPLNGRINRPYSLTRRDVGIDLSYRLPERTRLRLGYENRLRERDFSEVESAREHVFKVGLRTDRFDRVTLAADYSRERRDADAYVGNRPLLATRVPGSVDEDDFENHPLLRKYNMSDRDRDRVMVRADAHPDARVHVGVAFAWNRDDYGDLLGLNESILRSWILDAGFAPTETVRLGAFYHRDRYDNDQSGRAFTAAPTTVTDPDRNWFVDASDRYDTLGATLDFDRVDRHLPWLRRFGLAGELDLVLEATRSRTTGAVDVTSGPALDTASLPDLSTRLGHYRLEARYRISDASRVRLAWSHERYRSSDFGLDDVAPDTVANVLLFGEASPRYVANWVTLSFAHRF